MITDATHLFDANMPVGNILIGSSASYEAIKYIVIDCFIGSENIYFVLL